MVISVLTTRKRIAPRRTAGSAPRLLLALFLLFPILSSCHPMTMRVGMGSNGIGQNTMQQYYLFFGLIQLNEVDIQRVVGDYTSYDVEFGFSYRDGFLVTMGDFFISTLLFPLTVTRQAVTVKY